MPAANLNPSPANASAAPATGGAAPAGAANGASGNAVFDAILMLEEMAAAATDVGVDAGAAELGADADVELADDEDDLEADDPLAFLAGLIAIAPQPHVAHGAAGEGGDGAAALTGGAGGDPDAGMAFLADVNRNGAGSETDDAAAAAARALAAQAALSAGDARGTDDSPVSSRAVDFLTQTSRPVASAADHAPITTHARDPRWADEFGTRIALLVNQRESVAALSLTPVDLGPVDVSITVRDSQATIHFGAAQAETRALIEASLPKLRELLAAQGFQLLDASVSQGFTRQPRPDAPSIARPTSIDEPAAIESRTVTLNGLLDTYA